MKNYEKLWKIIKNYEKLRLKIIKNIKFLKNNKIKKLGDI